MINQTSLDNKLAIDAKGVSDLKQAARQNSPEAIKGAAKQFEALFLNQMLKSMREASPQDGAFDSEQTRMYTAMLDQQLSQNMAARGIGLADLLAKQLSRGSTGAADGSAALGGAVLPWAPGPAPAADATPSVDPVRSTRTRAAKPAHVQAFQDRISAEAQAASKATGIPAKFMIGQAALESGWGKREIIAADGTRSHNLFGIKAGAGWKGKVVMRPTTEYVDGVPQTKMQKFRAYGSYAEAFQDYARLLRSNPRYQNVLANAQDARGFAQGLQRAGYATDPQYAAKLTRIITQSLA